MKQSVKDKAIAALRTTTAPQCAGGYRRTDLGIEAEYCALGVIAEAFGYNWRNCGLEPVPDFLGDLGFNQHLRFRVMEMNDFHHVPFSEIAEYLDDAVQAEDDTNLAAEVEDIVSQVESLTRV